MVKDWLGNKALDYALVVQVLLWYDKATCDSSLQRQLVGIANDLLTGMEYVSHSASLVGMVGELVVSTRVRIDNYWGQLGWKACSLEKNSNVCHCEQRVIGERYPHRMVGDGEPRRFLAVGDTYPTCRVKDLWNDELASFGNSGHLCTHHNMETSFVSHQDKEIFPLCNRCNTPQLVFYKYHQGI